METITAGETYGSGEDVEGVICGGDCAAAAAFLAASSVSSSVSVIILPMSFAKIDNGDAVGGEEEEGAGADWSRNSSGAS